MNNKRFALFCLVMLVSTFFLCGCGSDTPSVVKENRSDTANTRKIDFSAVKTRGNNSYIPLDIVGNPDTSYGIILDVLHKFESAHPDLEVLDWKTEISRYNSGSIHKFYGIWVHHRPRQK